MRNRGRFIVFEGIDGCGKTTHAKRLAEQLRAEFTSEPFYEEEIRRILREEQDAYSHAEELAELFIEDRKEHLIRFIYPIVLLKERDVVCDRYDLSTIAYQSAQGLDMEELIDMHRGMLSPHITFYIDVPVEVAIQRSKKTEKKFESHKDFQEKVRQNYLQAIKFLKQRNRRIEVINGDQTKEDVYKEILAAWRLFQDYWKSL